MNADNRRRELSLCSFFLIKKTNKQKKNINKEKTGRTQDLESI